jgi:hypothetical protein
MRRVTLVFVFHIVCLFVACRILLSLSRPNGSWLRPDRFHKHVVCYWPRSSSETQGTTAFGGHHHAGIMSHDHDEIEAA